MGIGVDVWGSPRGQRCCGQPGAILGRLRCREVPGVLLVLPNSGSRRLCSCCSWGSASSARL